jgi:putative FmdB family regulatory protein
MPIYEYSCRACSNEFEALVRGSKVPVCPKCQSADLERLLSLPTVTSETTRGMVRRDVKRRDHAQATDQAREQRKYELSHDD